MGDPETWIPQVEAGENVQNRSLTQSSLSLEFGALSANYWARSVVWYDTASQQSGRLAVVNLNTTSANVITMASSQVSLKYMYLYNSISAYLITVTIQSMTNVVILLGELVIGHISSFLAPEMVYM